MSVHPLMMLNTPEPPPTYTRMYGRRTPPAPTAATRRRGFRRMSPDIRIAGAAFTAPATVLPVMAPFMIPAPVRIMTSAPQQRSLAALAIASRTQHEGAPGLRRYPAPRDDQPGHGVRDLRSAGFAADLPDGFHGTIERARVVAVPHPQTPPRGVDGQAAAQRRLAVQCHPPRFSGRCEPDRFHVLEFFVR